jgi:hypothetical protein
VAASGPGTFAWTIRSNGNIDFGGGTLDHPAGFFPLIVGFDEDDKYVFSKGFVPGGAGDMEPLGMGLDPGGNIALMGQYDGSTVLDLGGGPLPVTSGGSALFVARFAPDSAHLWSHGFPGHFYDTYADNDRTDQKLAVGPDGDVFFFTYFDGTVDVGAGPVTDTGEGSPIVAFSVEGDVDLGGGTLPAMGAGTRDIVVVKLGKGGQHLWSKRFYGGGVANGMCTDAEGNLYLTGLFGGSVSFGGRPLTAPHDQSALFVAKLNKNGDHVWSRGYDWAEGWSIAATAPGVVFLVGHADNGVDFGAGPLPNGPFVAKLIVP